MAVLSTIQCQQCDKAKDVMHSPMVVPRICHECTAINRDAARQAHFAELDKLTDQERIRKIEEWIYDYRPPVPLSETRF